MVTADNILLLEDDAESLIRCQLMLESMGFTVDITTKIDEAKTHFNAGRIDLIIIHVAKLPSVGLEFCHWARDQSNVPIVMLTDRHEKVTEQMCLEAGADDYAVRPVSKKILLARVTQQLQRSHKSLPKAHQIIEWGTLSLDMLSHTFTANLLPIEITASEFYLLALLMKKPNQVFTRAQILQSLGIGDGPGSEHIVNSHISRLRNKIKKAGVPDTITSVRGIGFKFAAAVKPALTQAESSSRKIRLVRP
jgi:two-component system response regulator MtrA